jgi:hypothetical protein
MSGAQGSWARPSPSPPVAVISGEAARNRGPGISLLLIAFRITMSRRGLAEAAEGHPDGRLRAYQAGEEATKGAV